MYCLFVNVYCTTATGCQSSYRQQIYIISYHNIISYHIIPYHIISYHIMYHIISYHIVSYHIISYHTIYHIKSRNAFNDAFFCKLTCVLHDTQTPIARYANNSFFPRINLHWTLAFVWRNLGGGEIGWGVWIWGGLNRARGLSCFYRVKRIVMLEEWGGSGRTSKMQRARVLPVFECKQCTMFHPSCHTDGS